MGEAGVYLAGQSDQPKSSLAGPQQISLARDVL